MAAVDEAVAAANYFSCAAPVSRSSYITDFLVTFLGKHLANKWPLFLGAIPVALLLIIVFNIEYEKSAGNSSDQKPLPQDIECEGQVRSDVFTLFASRSVNGYDVSIYFSEITDTTTAFRISDNPVMKSFELVDVSFDGFTLHNLSGRTSSTIDFLLSGGQPSIIDDGSLFFHNSMRCYFTP